MAKVLWVFAHPDDELAAAVAIAEHVAAGHEVHILWITRGEASSVLDELNGIEVDPWWGIAHNPTAEGYSTLDVDAFGQSRVGDSHAAVRLLATGLPGTLTVHNAARPDGAVSVVDAMEEINLCADLIDPVGPIRLKSHTYIPQLDNHSDHLAIGAAVKNLGDAEPDRYGDRRYYVLPAYWSDPDLSLVSWTWDTPSNPGITRRVINACRAHSAWRPPYSFATAMHSLPSLPSTIMSTPKSLVHS